MNGIQVKNLVKTYTTQSTDIILNGAKRPLDDAHRAPRCVGRFSRGEAHGDLRAERLRKEHAAAAHRRNEGRTRFRRNRDAGGLALRAALARSLCDHLDVGGAQRRDGGGAGRTPEERLELAKKLVKLVRLEDYADMTPVELSTGMRQRLGLARVLASQAQVLLMDEPFASLDFITRGELQAELLDIQKELQKTILLVTHQLDEALLLAQRIVVLHADSSVRVWELELPYPRDLTSPQLAALREEITAECRKD